MSSHHATLLSADERIEVSRAHGMDPLSAVTLPAPKGGLRLSQSPAGLGECPKQNSKIGSRALKLFIVDQEKES